MSEPSTSSWCGEERAEGRAALRMVETLHIGLREGRNLGVRRGVGTEGRSLFCLLKLDKEEIYTSTHVAKSSNPVFSDDLVCEVPPTNFRQLHLYVCEQSSGRVPHPFLRLSLKKSDIIKLCHSNGSNSDYVDRFFRLKPYSRQSEITGKVCLEVTSEECLSDSAVSRRIKIRVLDFAGLSLPSGGSKPVDLYALVTVQSGNRRLKTEKLKIPQKYQRSRRLWESAESGLSSSMELSSGGKTTPDLPSSVSVGPVSPSGLLQSDPPTLVMELDAGQLPLASSRSMTASLVDSALWRSNQDGGSWSPSTSEPPSPCSLDDVAGEKGPRAFPIPPPLDNPKQGSLEIRISLWHDIGVFNSFFHGQVHIPLESPSGSLRAKRPSKAPQWYCLKPRDSDKTSSNHSDGELRLRLGYRVKHILPLNEYHELWDSLLSSLPAEPSPPPSSSDSSPSSPLKGFPPLPRPFAQPSSGWEPWKESGWLMGLSALGILEHLPATAVEDVTRPLVRIFLQAEKLRPLIRRLTEQEIALTSDVNTLFRGPSLASHAMSAAMKLLGHQYLFQTIKQPIDRIFTERKNCEIDPSRLGNPADVEENTQNLFEYTQLVLGRVADSNHRCPRELKNILGDIRASTKLYHPGKAGVELLAVSSFILLRFFSAAIFDPKHFGIKRDNPDPVVARTLALISKILQKVSNYVVCGRRMVAKETWLQPILDRFMDESHAKSVQKYLEMVSEVDGEPTSISTDSVNILREGPLTQRLDKSPGCWEWASLKRAKTRHVILTDSDLVWGKSKDSLSGRMSLELVEELGLVEEEERLKNAFVVATQGVAITLQAPSQIDAQDWLTAIKRQVRRKRSSGGHSLGGWRRFEEDVELERELETLHMVLFANANLMHQWKCILEGLAHPADVPALPKVLTADLVGSTNRLAADTSIGSLATVSLSPSEAPVSLSDVSLSPCVLEQRRGQLCTTLETLLRITFCLEMAHTAAIESYFREIKYGSKDLPIGDDNYLLLKSRIKDARGLRRLGPAPPPLPARQSSPTPDASPPPLPARLHPPRSPSPS